MGCLKLHNNYNADLKVSWINDCLRYSKTENKERSCYVFGLEMSGISSRAANSTPNKEKTFQAQRFDDELDLNWVQFKWRNHDPQIGRFIEIDPLANDYVYNSTYAFSENKVTAHVELEGLESFSIQEIWRSIGWNQGTTGTSIIKGMGEALKDYHTYGRALETVMPMVGVGLLGLMTEGMGTTGCLRAISPARTTATAESVPIPLVRQNAAQGAAFEQEVVQNLTQAGHTNMAQQVSIKANNGVTTRIDVASTNSNGQLVLTEAKSSQTAPLTGNQKLAFPSIAQNGGVVVGAGKPTLVGGTVIPPTPVNVVRPLIQNNFIAPAVDNTYLKPPIIIPLLPAKKG